MRCDAVNGAVITSMREPRDNKYNMVHHLARRISHRAFFLDADNRFIDVMKRSAMFDHVYSHHFDRLASLLVVYFDRNSSALKLEKVLAMNLSQTHRSFRRMTCRNNMRDCVGVVDLVKNEATIIDLDRFRWNDKVSPVATVVVRYDGALHVDCE